MTSFGPQAISHVVGYPIEVLFNANDTEWKPGGITLDWTTVAEVSGAAVTLPNAERVAVGNAYLRYGQVVCYISGSGAANGKYGPYDPDATDGRQALTRAGSYIVNQTVVRDGALGFSLKPTSHFGVFNGGLVWKGRVLATSGTHSLASGPTWAEFEAAFPDIKYGDLDI